ncbi:MAG TPA: hypothetical protein DCM62_10410 [Bacteroidales bacterium]|nr:hypothetical protein [Bacteroidales bacterium]
MMLLDKLNNARGKYLAVLLLIFLIPSVSIGSQVSFTIQIPAQVSLGERFSVVFSSNKRAADFQAPSFDGFRIVSGPAQSSSTSVQIVNGQVSQTETYSFTYILESIREGTFRIERASVVIDGRRYSTNPATIMVTPRTQTPTPGVATPSRVQPNEEVQISSDDIFVRATASKSNPFVGEQITVTYRLYTRLQVSQYGFDEAPGFQGFWAENITPEGQPQTSHEVVNGSRYTVAVIKQVALIPQKAGSLRVEPLYMNTVVRVQQARSRGSILDSFFGGSFFDNMLSVEHPIISNPLNIQVRALPRQNVPDGFNGAVGQMNFNATLSDDSVGVDSPITLTMIVEGSGNLQMVNVPELNFPAEIESFEAQAIDDFTTNITGTRGSRQFELLLIPRASGNFALGPIQFIFFNPATGRYQVIASRELQIVVSPVANITAQNQVVHPQTIDFLNADIRFIHITPFSLQLSGTTYFKSPRFFIKIVLLILGFWVFVWLWRRGEKAKGNLVLLRYKKAHKMALKRLSNASKRLKAQQNAEFFEEVFKALWGYISDKLALPVSKLSRATVQESFEQLHVDPETTKEFFDVLDVCEFARFAPVAGVVEIQNTFKKALHCIVSLEKELNAQNK